MSTSQQIIDKYQVKLAALTGYDAETVKQGAFVPTSPGKSYIQIVHIKDRGLEIDGSGSNRRLRLLIAALVRIDKTNTTDSAFKQTNTEWERINNVLEQFQRDNAEGLACQVTEAEPGVEILKYDDKDNWGFAGVIHDIEYERALETN